MIQECSGNGVMKVCDTFIVFDHPGRPLLRRMYTYYSVMCHLKWYNGRNLDQRPDELVGPLYGELNLENGTEIVYPPRTHCSLSRTKSEVYRVRPCPDDR